MNFEQNTTGFRRYLYFKLPGYLFVNDCLMSEFLLRRENSPGLKKLVHTEEFALQKNNRLRVNSLNDTCLGCLRFYYIPDGKPDWLIYAEEDYLETGSLYWLHLHLNIQKAGSKDASGHWSNISPPEVISTRKLFLNNVSVLSKPPDAGSIFSLARNELLRQEIGYVTRVNHLPDESLIHYQ